ncbi:MULTISPECIES: hypothetical protein [Streptomyces]|uniref:hypothetical protein n=1 Tax=Streptomyces TaxID=1883 RepID=UPI00345B8DCC
MNTRFEFRPLPNDATGIWDNYRSRFARRLPAKSTAAEADAALRAIERERTWATVIYREPRRGPKGSRWETTVVTGDLVSCHPRERVVIVNSDWVTIPAAQHIRTIRGTTVHGYRRVGGGPWAAVLEPTDRVDVAGWTAPRHQQLHILTQVQQVPTWFDEFARRYGLGTRSSDHGRIFRFSGGTEHGLKPNNAAYWLLRRWNVEHPELATP